MPVNKFKFKAGWPKSASCLKFRQDGEQFAVSENLFEDFAPANTVLRTIKIIVVRF